MIPEKLTEPLEFPGAQLNNYPSGGWGTGHEWDLQVTARSVQISVLISIHPAFADVISFFFLLCFLFGTEVSSSCAWQTVGHFSCVWLLQGFTMKPGRVNLSLNKWCTFINAIFISIGYYLLMNPNSPNRPWARWGWRPCVCCLCTPRSKNHAGRLRRLLANALWCMVTNLKVTNLKKRKGGIRVHSPILWGQW